MSRCPFAQWRGPVPGYTPGGMAAGPHGVVFHIMGASLAAADGWFHNPSSQVSAHFGIGQDGTLVQWVDTYDKAWHAAAANPHWFGVETEGSSGPLSEAGCQTFGRLYRWLADTQGAVTTIANDPTGPVGFGWHGMGGAAWGSHVYCPGIERENQRQHILDLANQGDDDLTPEQAQQLAEAHAAALSTEARFGTVFGPGEPDLMNSFIEDYRRLKQILADCEAIKAKLGA